jgi:hypothetical protein
MQGKLSVKLIGVNDASVSRVFCQTHDSDTFYGVKRRLEIIGSMI